MIHVVLISQNREAEEILKTVRRLFGPLPNFLSLTFPSSTSVKEMQVELKKTLKRIGSKHSVLVLVDFFGSTQCNICVPSIKKNHVEVISGFNLAMVAKLASVCNTMPFSKLGPYIAAYGRERIFHITNPSQKVVAEEVQVHNLLEKTQEFLGDMFAWVRQFPKHLKL